MSEEEVENPFRKGIPWKERRLVIFEHFPSVENIDWVKVFTEDPAIMGRIVNDILRLENAQSRPGKRPALEREKAEKRLRQMRGDDYTTKPFPEAFKILKGDRSLRHVARNTGIDKMVVRALLRGEREPTVDDMVAIAEGFNKHPSYFVEYRMMFVLSFLGEIMLEYPEFTAVHYEKIREGGR